MMKPIILLASLVTSLVVGGCATFTPVQPGSDERFAVTLPEPAPHAPAALPPPNQGSIYHSATAVNLFQDFKARRVGDVLSVVLAEQTNARKSANASSTKSSSVEIAEPTLFGRGVTHDGVPIFNASAGADRDFEGQGDAAQSNLLEGTITVTVAEVLPNGNLMVQGEKWVRINHGEEYIRLRGIVRPVDIRADNTVISTQIGNAEVAYGGTGTLAHSSEPGWASRFFNSPLWPF